MNRRASYLDVIGECLEGHDFLAVRYTQLLNGETGHVRLKIFVKFLLDRYEVGLCSPVDIRVVELVDELAGQVLITRDRVLRKVLEPLTSRAYEGS